MAFKTHTVKELKEVAEYFGVELDNVKGKDALIAAIEGDGVEYADAVKFVLTPEVDDDAEEVVEQPVVAAPAPTGPSLVVRMTRQNARYDAEAGGRLYTFTKENPYCVMPEADAEIITDREEGFRIASPSEVREFYG
jgi:hypothetical protein